MIDFWWNEGHQIRLEDAGNGNAEIVGSTKCDSGTFGTIEYDPQRNRHIITWNDKGCLALEQYKRDYFDSKFYYVMAAWRSRP